MPASRFVRAVVSRRRPRSRQRRERRHQPPPPATPAPAGPLPHPVRGRVRRRGRIRRRPRAAPRPVDALRIAADPTAATTTTPISPAWTAHARPAPSAVAIDAVPAAWSRSTSARALAIASAAPATTATGTRIAEDRRQRASGAEPAEDGQDRDPDGERQPRPGGALEPKVVGKPDRDDRDGDSDGRRTGGARQHEPERRSPRRRRRPRPAARRDATGIGLPGLCPASRGASTMSFVAPMPNWSAVIASPSLQGVDRWRAGEECNGPRNDPIKDRWERMNEADEAREPSRDSRGLRGVRRRRSR